MQYFRYKEDKLVKRSIRDISPKLYSEDAFSVQCSVRSKDRTVVSTSETPEVIIFDERGEQFAATFINCPLEAGSQPSQVNIITLSVSPQQHNNCPDFRWS